jgi:peptidoglycan/xylan/chitin deacetylase (PgdA/CDA1 family)
VKEGDILLFHDTSGITAEILENLIVTLQGKKYRFVPLDELINTPVYE